MAGTVVFRLRVAHTFQRKFDSSALAAALDNCHLYVISRRHSTRLITPSMRVERGEVGFSVEIGSEEGVRYQELSIDLRRLGTPREFKAHLDGAYFSYRIGQSLMHGDAWALASLASGVDASLSGQEVMYIGQAFGAGGESGAWTRTKRHSTLQQIYADHAGESWDVFVSPLLIENVVTVGDDHIRDADLGPDMERYWNEIVAMEGRPLKAAIDLVEHALISYFKPSYNSLLKNWQIHSPTASMRKLLSAGFRLLIVELDCAASLVRFYSAEEPDPVRGHMIVRKLEQVAQSLNLAHTFGTAAIENMVQFGPAYVSEVAEISEAVLRSFGDEAPVIRRPKGLALAGAESSSVPPTRSWTDPIEDARPLTDDERFAIVREFPLSEFPTYSPAGFVGVRPSRMTSWQRWWVHDSERMSALNGLMIGPGNVANLFLEQLALEIIRSRVFTVVPLLAEGEDLWPSLGSWSTGSITRVSTGLDPVMATIVEVVKRRMSRLAARPPINRISIGAPGLILLASNFDDVMRNERASRTVSRLIPALPDLGIGLHAVVRDPGLLEAPSPLTRALLDAANLAVVGDSEEFGEGLVERLRYLQSQVLDSCWSETAYTFACWHTSRNAGVGQVVALNPVAKSRGEAQAWAHYLIPDSEYLIEWRLIGGAFLEAWDALSARRWVLLKSVDGWLLIQEYASTSYDSEVEPAGYVFAWARSHLNACMTLPNRTYWRRSPGSPDVEMVAIIQLGSIEGWIGRAATEIWKLVGGRLETATS